MQFKIMQIPNDKYLALKVERQFKVITTKKLFGQDDVNEETTIIHEAISKNHVITTTVDIHNFRIEDLAKEYQFEAPQLAQYAIHKWVENRTIVTHML